MGPSIIDGYGVSLDVVRRRPRRPRQRAVYSTLVSDAFCACIRKFITRGQSFERNFGILHFRFIFARRFLGP